MKKIVYVQTSKKWPAFNNPDVKAYLNKKKSK